MGTRTVRNYNWVDLHPEDRSNRSLLRGQLRRLADQHPETHASLSMGAGHMDTWLRHFWHRLSWRVATVQNVATVLGVGFDLRAPVDGLVLPPVSDELSLLEALYPPAVNHAGFLEVRRRHWCDLARRVREALGISAVDLGRRLTMAPTRLREWESGDRPDYLLVTVQRVFRALERPLSLTLLAADGSPLPEPIRGPEEPPAPAEGEYVRIVEGAHYIIAWNTLRPEEQVTFTRHAWDQWLNEPVS